MRTRPQHLGAYTQWSRPTEHKPIDTFSYARHMCTHLQTHTYIVYMQVCTIVCIDFYVCVCIENALTNSLTHFGVYTLIRIVLGCMIEWIKYLTTLNAITHLR